MKMTGSIQLLSWSAWRRPITFAFSSPWRPCCSLSISHVISHITTTIKTRDDGSLKIRFVLDLLRSGASGRCRVPERVVLPRVCDVVHSLLFMIIAWASFLRTFTVQAYVSMATIDFKDAFYTIHLKLCDRGMTTFATLRGYAYFARVPFGLASAPLIWARVAALLMRIGQAPFASWELMLHCFVDDPAIVLGGSLRDRKHNLGLLLLLWSALGAQLAWPKAAHGHDVEWIGIRVWIKKLFMGKRLCAPSFRPRSSHKS